MAPGYWWLAHLQAEPPLLCPSAAGGDERDVRQPSAAVPQPLSEVILN